MLTDPIADFLIQIKNSYLARKEKVILPHSKVKESLAKLLSKEGYVGTVGIEKKDKVKKFLSVGLIYLGKKPRLTEVIRVSKPGKRVYVSKNKIPKVLGGKGMAIISTPSGFMTDREALVKGFGGELICKMW